MVFRFDLSGLRKAGTARGRMKHVYIVDIYEPHLPFPILTHIFRGSNRVEAWSVFLAHMRTDRFLASCVDQDGEFTCTAVGRWDTEL